MQHYAREVASSHIDTTIAHPSQIPSPDLLTPTTFIVSLSLTIILVLLAVLCYIQRSKLESAIDRLPEEHPLKQMWSQYDEGMLNKQYDATAKALSDNFSLGSAELAATRIGAAKPNDRRTQ